jgi:7-carboxy-7-deazaguanine synthase
MMRVAEVFHSLQGEGTLVGQPSVFVRLAGCPFRCRWCDTAYAWEYSAGEELDPAGIVERISRWPCKHVVLTGGEPLMGEDLAVRPGLVDLTGRLRALGKHITIETAGTLFVPDLACDLISISPKLGNSNSPAIHQTGGADPAVLSRLIAAYPYQLKFVIESPRDIGEVQEVLGRLGPVDPARVLLMPQARTREELLARSPVVAELCRDTGFRFCDRLHIWLWGDHRGR